MTSENTPKQGSQDPASTSENTRPLPPVRRGRAPIELPDHLAAVLDAYATALVGTPLSTQTRRTYTSKARQYLAWLGATQVDGDPLDSAEARDWAVRDYRNHLQAVAKHRPVSVNNALAAIDDLYARRGLGPAKAVRIEIPDAAPRALDKRAQIRFLRAVQGCASPRDQALALCPFYARTRIAEVVALDVDDVRLSARKGILRIYGKGERVREVPVHSQLRTALAGWLDERPNWPGANDSSALFLNQRRGRLESGGRTSSSPASQRVPAWMTTPPPMCSGTRLPRPS